MIKIFDMSKLKENHFLTYVWKKTKIYKFYRVKIKEELISYLFSEIRSKINHVYDVKQEKNYLFTH